MILPHNFIDEKAEIARWEDEGGALHHHVMFWSETTWTASVGTFNTPIVIYYDLDTAPHV